MRLNRTHLRPMQLADHNRTNSKSMSPSIYTALVDSLFENPIPMLAGAVCAGTGAVMTAVKTGNPLLLAMRRPDHRHWRFAGPSA